MTSPTLHFYPTNDEGKCVHCNRRHHPGRGCPKVRKQLLRKQPVPRQAPPTYDVMVGDKVVASVEVENPTLVYFVKRDEPSKLLVGVDIDPVDLTLRVGHWPDGEEWAVALETQGVEATS